MKNTGRIPPRALAWIAAAAVSLLCGSVAQATTYYNMTGVDAASQASSFNQTINGAIFQTGTNTANVGTGVFQPFVRIQQNGNGNCSDPCIESGFNTDGTARFETKDAGASNWDHSLLLSNVGTDTIGGVKYRIFALDINEANNSTDRFLSLDKLQVYMGNTGNLDTFNETAPDGSCGSSCGLQNAKLIWDMDGTPGSATDRTVGLNYALNNGSGKGIDLTVRIRDDLFDPANGQYVYLYSSFGATGTINNNHWAAEGTPPNTSPIGLLPDGNYGQSAGFEEWSSKVGATGRAPEPMTVGLVLLGLTALGFSRRKRGNPGFAIR